MRLPGARTVLALVAVWVLGLALAPNPYAQQIYGPVVNSITMALWGQVFAYPNGITGDAFANSDGLIASLSTTLTAASRPCTAVDIGKTVIVAGAGAAGTIAAPAAPTVQAYSSGSLGATTYFVETFYYDAAGNKTAVSAETSTGALGANNLIEVQPPPPVSGAMGWGVGISNTAGGGSGAETVQQYVPLATNNVTVNGNPTLNFASVPSTIVPGMAITDVTDGTTVVPVKTYVLSTTATTVTMSQNAGGGGVTNGAAIKFSPVGSGITLAYPFWHAWRLPAAGLITGDAMPGSNTTNYAGPLLTTVSSCSGTAYTLAASNGSGFNFTGGNNTEWAIGTDISATLNTLVTNNPNATIVFPPGQFLFNANTVALAKIALQGQGQGWLAFGSGGSSRGFSMGTQFLLTSPTVVPFTVFNGVRWTGINFFYPGQWQITNGPSYNNAPFAYPPLVEDDGTDDVNSWNVDHAACINCFDFFKQVGSGSIKRVNWSELGNPWCIDVCLNYKNIGETISITGGTDFNFDAWQSSANPNALKKWSALNSVAIVVNGNGVPGGTCSTQNTGNLTVNGAGFHGFSSVVSAFGAGFFENQFNGIDVAAEQFITTDTGTALNNVEITGATIESGYSDSAFDLNLISPAMDYEGRCTGAQGGTKGLQFVGGSWAMQGYGINFTSNNIQNVVFSGISVSYCNSTSCRASYLLQAVDPNIDLSFVANPTRAGNAGAAINGIVGTTANQSTVVGNNFNQAQQALDLSAWTAGPWTFCGNTTQNTGGSFAIAGGTNGVGYQGLNISAGNGVCGNNLDKPLNVSITYTAAQTNTQLTGFPIGSPSFTQMVVEGCGPGGAGGAGIVSANPSGGAGGGGGDCHRKVFNISSLLSGTWSNNPFYVNGGNAGAASNNAAGGQGTPFTISKNATGCTAYTNFTGTGDVTDCIDSFGAGGGGALAANAATVVGGAGGTQFATGSTGSSGATGGCANSGGGNGAASTAGPSCGAGGSGGTNAASAGPNGTLNASGLGGAGGAAGGGYNGTAEAGGNGSRAVGCQNQVSGGSAGNGANGGSPSPSSCTFSYLPGSSGAGGGGADGTHTGGTGAAGTTGSGGGGGGSALTGGTNGQGGNGGAGAIRIYLQ